MTADTFDDIQARRAKNREKSIANMRALRRSRRNEGLCAICAKPSKHYRCDKCNARYSKKTDARHPEYKSCMDADAIGTIDDEVPEFENDWCGGDRHERQRVLADVLLDQFLQTKRLTEQVKDYKPPRSNIGNTRPRNIKIFYSCDERPGEIFSTYQVAAITGVPDSLLRATIAQRIKKGATAFLINGYTFRRLNLRNSAA